jgi:hypothetical protein
MERGVTIGTDMLDAAREIWFEFGIAVDPSGAAAAFRTGAFA